MASEPTQASTAIAVPSEELDALVASITHNISLPQTSSDPQVISSAIATRILEASSQEEVDAIADASLTGWDELEGVPVDVQGFRAQPSDYWDPKKPETGLPFFLIVTLVRRDTGEQMVVSTGSTNVVAALIRAARAGQLPLENVKLQKARKSTQAGYFPYWLVSAAS